MKNSSSQNRFAAARVLSQTAGRKLYRRKAVRAASALIALFVVFAQFQMSAKANGGGADITLGLNGKVTTRFSTATIEDLLIQPDGKIIAVGAVNSLYSIALARYNTNGTLDSSFGSGGTVTTRLTTFGSNAHAGALLPDGKIIVVGTVKTTSGSGTYQYAVERYNSDGSLDSTFGISGSVWTDIGADYDQAEDVVIQPDGKIVVAGTSYFINSQPYFDISMTRYNSNGSLDTTFGTGGIVTTDFGYDDGGQSVALQADGKILVAGYTRNVGTLNDVTLVRYNTNGSLDTSYGTGGRSVVALNGDYQTANDMVVQADGKVVVSVNLTLNATNMSVIRFNPDGALDSGFGAGGIANVSFGNGVSSAANAIALQADGKIVAAGYTYSILYNTSYEDMGAIRLNTNGTLDTGFGIDGKVITNFPYVGSQLTLDMARALAIQPDGKIIAAGSSQISIYTDFALVRYRPDTRPAAKPYDFDGDGKADVGVFRPANGGWYINLSTTGGLYAVAFGTNGDVPEAADYDNDGKTDLAVFRDGTWYILTSTGVFSAVQFGAAGDIPVAADYDGDGKADVAVFRQGTWYILRSSDGSFVSIQFGVAGDKPVPGDYNGDGRADVAVWRPSTGTWYTSTNPATNYDAFVWGINGDIPAPGDYNGDEMYDHAVYRQSTGTWLISTASSQFTVRYGGNTDIPVPADYDGDYHADFGVFRPATAAWYIRPYAANISNGLGWGTNGDIPVESGNVPYNVP